MFTAKTDIPAVNGTPDGLWQIVPEIRILVLSWQRIAPAIHGYCGADNSEFAAKHPEAPKFSTPGHENGDVNRMLPKVSFILSNRIFSGVFWFIDS